MYYVHVLKVFDDMKSACFVFMIMWRISQLMWSGWRVMEEIHCRLETHLFKHCMSFCSLWITSPLPNIIFWRSCFIDIYPTIYHIKRRTLLFVGARIVQMQSTAWSGFTLYSSSTWLERIRPSAPDSSNWQSDPQTVTEAEKVETHKRERITSQ